MQGLYELLSEYSSRDYYPFHMPGHKRNIRCFQDAFAIDITEIDGFDNLHHAEGILLEAEKRAARLYGAEETHYLVNGSTAGILAAISACSRRGGRILMARNCHKSAYHAVFLNGLHVVWLYPDTDMVRGIYGSADPAKVRTLLEQNPGVSAVFLTSPTYDGVVSDIREIAAAAHEHGAVLIVDEAHGAHFAMHSCFPESAVSCGADIVINSIHKTMPSLTQTALIHICGPRIDRVRLRKYLGIYQSSSPSYVLMAGIDCCVNMMTERGEELFEQFCRRIDSARGCLSKMKKLHLVTGTEKELFCYRYDRSRILISTENCEIGGRELYRRLLDRYHIQAEMAAEHYVTLLTSVADTQEGFDRLCRALLEIDAELCAGDFAGEELTQGSGAIPEGERESGPTGTGTQSGHETAQEGERESGSAGTGTRSGHETAQEGERESGSAGTGTRSGHETAQEGERESGPIGTGTRSGHETAQEGEKESGSAGEMQDVRSAPGLPNEEVLNLEEAENSEKYRILLRESAGRVSGEYIYLYPPGIPLLIPGERITQKLLDRLEDFRRQGFELQGLDDYSGETIFVVCEAEQKQR